MRIEPIIIGIPGWKWKKELVHHARKYPRIATFALKSSMCYECSRHFEILKMFDDNDKDFVKSEYYQFYKDGGKNHQYIVNKVNNFYRLYLSIQKRYVLNNCPIITDDGCRLDGSHRMSILVYLRRKEGNGKHKWIDLNVPKYKYVFKDRKIDKIRRQVIAYRKEKYGLSTWTEKLLNE